MESYTEERVNTPPLPPRDAISEHVRRNTVRVNTTHHIQYLVHHYSYETVTVMSLYG